MAVHVLAGSHIVSTDTIDDLKRSLPRLGSGVSRTAFDLGNGTVLKVGKANSFAGGNQTEVAAWEALCDNPEVAPLLGEITAYDSEGFAWVIMRKADGVLGDNYTAKVAFDQNSNLKTILRAYGISDLHEGNIGYVEDASEDCGFRFFAVDYAMSGYCTDPFVSDAYSPSHCATCCRGCSSHSDKPRSDACCTIGGNHSQDCASLAGCNAVTCDHPECAQRAVRDLGTVRHLTKNPWFNGGSCDHIWESERAVVCGMHLPIGVHTANIAREIMGQIPLFGFRGFARSI